MSESSQRVKEWRKRHSEHGLKAMTIWFPEAQKARLEDLAKAWRRSTSELLLEAFTQCNPVSLPVTATVADTAQLQALIQDALVHAPAVTAYVTALVTDTVTATLTRDLPVLVRQLVEGLAREALGVPVTEMFGDVTDTEDESTDTFGNVTDTEIPGLPVTDTNGNPTDTEPRGEAPAPRRGGRPLGAMGQRIVALLGAHPEGLSAEEIRASLKPERPLGDTLQSLRKRARVRTEGHGRALRYFVG
jgi:predicted transcriptional regulator